MTTTVGLSLGELAVRFGCTLKGDPDTRVSHVATLENADEQAVTFLANPRYRRYLSQTRAGVVVVEPGLADACPGAALLTVNPYATYARIAALLHPRRWLRQEFMLPRSSIHRLASIQVLPWALTRSSRRAPLSARAQLSEPDAW